MQWGLERGGVGMSYATVIIAHWLQGLSLDELQKGIFIHPCTKHTAEGVGGSAVENTKRSKVQC